MPLSHLRDSTLTAWRDGRVRWGVLGALLMALGAHTPLFLPRINPVEDVPWLRWLLSPEGTVLATVLLLAGTIALTTAWLRIRPRSDRETPPMRATILLWSVPLLLAPPLYSHDAYSYAAVGWMHENNLNPYELGPGAVSGYFRQQVDPFWLLTPTPYGPLALEIQRWIVVLVGDHPYLAAVAMRLMAMAGVVLLLWAIPRLARWVGVRGDLALWWGVANPLTIMHFVGGAHNDALMVGLLAVALWVCTRGGPWQSLVIGSVLVAAAAAVKQPAAVGLLGTTALCTARLHPEVLSAHRASLLPTSGEPWLSQAWPDIKKLLLPSIVAALVFAASFALITWATGLGYGWLPALSVPGMATGLSPISLLGGLLASALAGIGLGEAAPVVKGTLKYAGMAVTVGLVLLASLRVLRIGGIAFTAWTLLIVALLGQTVHPWYILWGLPLLPLAGMRPEVERAALWLTYAVVAYSLFDTGARSGQVVIGLACVVVLFFIFRDRPVPEGRRPSGHRLHLPEDHAGH